MDSPKGVRVLISYELEDLMAWKLKSLLCGLSTCACLIILAGKEVSAEPTKKFAVFGDMPYEADVEGGIKDSDVLRQQIYPGIRARDDILFTIHLGDIGRPNDACTTDFRERTKEEWSQYFYADIGRIKPVYYTPGDNDWTDCSRDPVNIHPLESWAELRSIFFDNDLNQGRHISQVSQVHSQSSQRENKRWVDKRLAHDGYVLFTTVHFVGSQNGHVETFNGRAWGLEKSRLNNEADRRERNGLDWLDQSITLAQDSESRIRAIVIAAHVDPFAPLELPNRPNYPPFRSCLQKPFYSPLCRKLESFNNLRIPVLFVHGDTNAYCLDQPMPGAPNVWRLNAPGDFTEIDAHVVEIDRTDYEYPFKVRGLLSNLPPPPTCDYTKKAIAPAYPKVGWSAGIQAGDDGGRDWVDFNGDGRLDFCRVNGNEIGCHINKGGGVFAAQTIGTSVSDAGGATARFWADINGDRRSDYCRHLSGSSRIRCTPSRGTDFEHTDIESDPVDGGDYSWWVDFNGDGRDDFCRAVNRIKLKCLLGGEPAFGPDVESPDINLGYSGTGRFADINGDKRADFCRLVPSQESIIRCTLAGDNKFGAEVESHVDDPGGANGWWWVDFNGDGKDDFCRIVGGDDDTIGGDSREADSLRCSLSTGISSYWAEITSGSLNTGSLSEIGWVDTNGDGRADYCRLVEDSTRIRCTLSGGDRFANDVEIPFVTGGEANFSNRKLRWLGVRDDDKTAYFCSVESSGIMCSPLHVVSRTPHDIR